MRVIDVLNSPWAIVPDKLQEIQAIYATHLRGEKIDIKGIEAKLGQPLQNKEQGYEVIDGVAVIPVDGVVSKRMNLFQPDQRRRQHRTHRARHSRRPGRPGGAFAAHPARGFARRHRGWHAGTGAHDPRRARAETHRHLRGRHDGQRRLLDRQSPPTRSSSVRIPPPSDRSAWSPAIRITRGARKCSA